VGQNHARCQNCAIPHRCFTSARRLVAMAGVEPARPKTPGLESGASPCFTTWPLSLLLRRDLCQLGYSARCVLRLGIEPRTCGLRGRRSAAELPERGADDGSRTRNNQLGGLVPGQLGLIRRYTSWDRVNSTHRPPGFLPASVGTARLELASSWSQARRAADCATSRCYWSG
jgi:hypothetical protein